MNSCIFSRRSCAVSTNGIKMVSKRRNTLKTRHLSDNLKCSSLVTPIHKEKPVNPRSVDTSRVCGLFVFGIDGSVWNCAFRKKWYFCGIKSRNGIGNGIGKQPCNGFLSFLRLCTHCVSVHRLHDGIGRPSSQSHDVGIRNTFRR